MREKMNEHRIRENECEWAARDWLRLLRQLDGQLALGLGHLAPQLAQIGLHGFIAWILTQSESEPAIGGGEIVRRAQSRRIKRAHLDHGFGVGAVGGGLEQAEATIAILGHAASVKIFLRFGDGVDAGNGLGCGRWSCRSARGTVGLIWGWVVGRGGGLAAGRGSRWLPGG